MKHLFTIHSPLTFLVAYSIVEHLGLHREDVIFLSHNYKVPIESFRVEPAFQDIYQSLYKKLQTLNVPKHYDRYIDKITDNDSFIAYIDLMSYYQKILVTHEKCRQFHFFEEGNSAYQEFDDLTDISWNERHMPYRNERLNLKSITRAIRGYNLRLLALPYIYSAYSNMKDIQFFAFSENAFYNLNKEKRVLLKPDTSTKEMVKMAGGHQLKNATIWLDGSNARYTGLTDDYYHRAIKKGIQEFKKKGIINGKVHVKLRPGIKNIDSNELVRILREHKIEIEVLPDNMVLEAFFMRSIDCKVIGTLTAALEYAHVFGHKAYSIYPYFEKQPPTFFDRMTGFWKHIQNA